MKAILRRKLLSDIRADNFRNSCMKSSYTVQPQPHYVSKFTDALANDLWQNESRMYHSWMRHNTMVFQSKRSSKSGNGKLSETSIIHQEGNEIQEVPIAVLKTSGSAFGDNKDEERSPSYIKLDVSEEEACVEAFRNYNSPQEILKMLDTIPANEVTPNVAVGILRRLFEVENNFGFRNNGLSWTASSENSVGDTFTRSAVVSRLIDTIVTSEDNKVLLSTLEALKYEKISDVHFYSSCTLQYRKKVFDEVLLKVTQGNFSITEVCTAVINLGQIEEITQQSHTHNLIDKLWIGIYDKSNEIGIEEIIYMFKALRFFKKSQRLVLNLVEKKVLSIWWKMNPQDVSKICASLIVPSQYGPAAHWKKVLEVSNRLLSALSNCMALNIHSFTDVELATAIQTFKTFNFCDHTVDKSLNKYMKAKGVKIINPHIVVLIMEYVKQFNMRSPHILEAAAEFTLANLSKFSPQQMTSVISTIGHLDYLPTNGVKFWQSVEEFLSEKFIQFPCKDILDIFFSCICLQKFPLNFVERIFSPYFLDRLHTSEPDINRLQAQRTLLKLIDTSFTIECPAKYSGPLLPKDFTAKSVFIDGRITRTSHVLADVLNDIFGDSKRIETGQLVAGLPLNAFYIADILISNSGYSDNDYYHYLKNRVLSRLNSGITPENNPRNLTVMVIHLPDHYSRDGQQLLGPALTRLRHYKLLGFNVAAVSFDKVCEIRSQPEVLKDYVKTSLLDSGCV